MSSRNRAFVGFCLAVIAAVAVVAPLVSLFAAEAPKPAEPAVDFAREVQPIFAKRCLSCHGPDEAEGGLRLDDKESVFGELESGARAIVAGNAKRSLLLTKISADDPAERMPPEGKPLSKSEIETIRRWIEQGAEWKSHWAFERPRSQAPPSVSNAAWIRNPIDAFILRSLEDRGLSPNPPAGKIALMRRAYYDLTGLPPSPVDVDEFLADTSPDAYEQLIDRLLASPQYGERWARHWLDAVRYAETNSFERDGPKPNAWRYRDYVIRSFNDDKPYDMFIREQLAGDELPVVTHDSIIATGFYRLGLWDDEPADEKQARFDELDDIVSTTSQVFLALTVNCARCHDHKIDPIPQDDYYRLLAYFHELQPYGIRADQTSWNQTDIGDPEVAQLHTRADEQRTAVAKQMTVIEDAVIARMTAEFQRLAEGADREKVIRDKLQETATADEWQKYTSLRDELKELKSRELPHREMALSVKCLPEPPETFVLARGNPHVAGKKVEPGVPKVFQAADPQVPGRSAGAKSSGRRLALANWIASPDNMLTARVMVNRIWQFHFGRGIVRSSNNFGQLGDPPTHPELLDWLAQEFVEGGWRMKPLHKLIMLSSAYRMSSEGRADAIANDPQNQFFWRFDMRRLSAEEVRDSIHAVTGLLNPKMYGPSYYPEISAEVLAGQSMPGAGWGKSSDEEQARRSIYIHVKRSLITPILADLDFPEPDVSCAARFATVHPAQALGMMNGAFMHEQAAKLAERLTRESGDDRSAQVKRALRLAVHREPTAAEVERGVALIESLEGKRQLSKSDALKYYCLVVLNLNEFVYLD